MKLMTAELERSFNLYPFGSQDGLGKNSIVVDREDALSDHPYLYVRGLGWRLPRE